MSDPRIESESQSPPVSSSGFRPAWWLPGPHLQTLWAALVRRRGRPVLERERLELPDGDFLDLDWNRAAPANTPVVVVLHGLEGSSASPYAWGLLAAFERRGWSAVVMHFRGCGGEPNRLARSYHSGETGDLARVIEDLRRRFPHRPLFAAGVSLGGNVLLKWLGEIGSRAPLAGAAAVSVPLDLGQCAERIEQGFSKVYRRYLVRALHRKLRAKFGAWEESPIDLAALPRWRTFREFDENVTAPLHGFTGAEDYYRRASSGPFVARIRKPTLIVQARNDPFLPGAAVPPLAPCVRLDLPSGGGHAGFVQGAVPGRPRYWLEERIPGFFEEILHRAIRGTQAPQGRQCAGKESERRRGDREGATERATKPPRRGRAHDDGRIGGRGGRRRSVRVEA